MNTLIRLNTSLKVRINITKMKLVTIYNMQLYVTKESCFMFLRRKTWFNFNYLAQTVNKYLYWFKTD